MVHWHIPAFIALQVFLGIICGMIMKRRQRVQDVVLMLGLYFSVFASTALAMLSPWTYSFLTSYSHSVFVAFLIVQLLIFVFGIMTVKYGPALFRSIFSRSCLCGVNI